MVISGGTNIVSTNPENDPANTHPANKGVLERNTDVDIFSFVTGNGPVRLEIKPWIVAFYSASMDTNPNWTFDALWQYGTPNYSSGGPSSGFTGSQVIAYNLRGNYANGLSTQFATTPSINTTGSTSLTLRFRRWLQLKNGDTASIQVSANGGSWISLWSTNQAVSDPSWQLIQYKLPASVLGSSSLRLRWGLASGPTLNDIGWNIDDVELLGSGDLDSAPPLASLSVANLTQAGSPTHSCGVTYTDATAVRLASLDSTDLLVTGPNGYSSTAEFIGADLPMDGSPITASYAIPAPGGVAWSAAHNGSYSIALTDEAVEDTLNNLSPLTPLGTFTVAINTAAPGVLIVEIAIQGTVGTPVVLEASEDLIKWKIIASEPIGPDGTLTLTDPESASLPTRYYRVTQP